MLSPRSVSPSLFPCCQRDEWVWYGCVLGCVYESKAEGQAYVVPHQHCPEKRGWPNIWQDPVLHYLERCSFKGGERGVVRRPAIACGHLPLFPKPSPNNSHQDSRHNWKSTNHYNVSQVFWHSANIQAAWLQDSFPSCELISSTQTSKWGRRIPCNASVISYRKTALNIFFIKVFAHETIYMLRGWMCQEPGLSWRSLWKKSSLVSEHSAPISWFLWTGNKRENEGKCCLICIHELGRNPLCHIGCHTIPLIKIKPIFQI